MEDFKTGMVQLEERTLSCDEGSHNVDETLLSEIRYKAFGEVRSSSGDTSTPYQYTGQLSQGGKSTCATGDTGLGRRRTTRMGGVFLWVGQ